MKELTDNIQKLAYKFAKFHYNKYLETHKIDKIKNEELQNIVESMFNEKQKELKGYVRSSLKNICKDNYNSFAVENIINEMFSDKNLVIERIILEIQNFQK